MGKVITITNRKGGTGKTCTAYAIGAGLSHRGYNALCIDLDPQESLTFDMGASSEGVTIMEVMQGEATAQEAIQHTETADIIAGSSELATADLIFTGKGKEYRLREAIEPIRDKYDFIICDTSPSLGIMTVNALTASDSTIITSQPEIHSLHGIGKLYETIKLVRKHTNPELNIEGILLTRYNGRAIISRDMKQNLLEVAQLLNTKVFSQPIRECTAVKEAEAMQRDIFTFAPRSNASRDYNAVLDEIIGVSEERREALSRLLGVD